MPNKKLSLRTRKPGKTDPASDTSISPGNIAAHKQAEEDIENDPELSTKPLAEDDLDEGELARLEGEKESFLDVKKIST